MIYAKFHERGLALLFSAALLCHMPLFAQNNNKHDEPISDEHYDILNTRKNLIERETAAGKNEWSGAYRQGDHHPTVFMWSPGEGFLTWGSNHTFSPSRINFGKAVFLNDRLTIEPEISKEHLNFQFVPLELVPVKWGAQHFLVAPDEMDNFAFAVHSGAESQIVEYFVKSEDIRKDRVGLPDLPKELLPILKMKAIKPRIRAIKNDDPEGMIFNAEISLSLGSEAKIIEGMTFYFANSEGSVRIRVTEVRERSSIGKVWGLSGDGEPKVGMRLTSKIPKDSIDF